VQIGAIGPKISEALVSTALGLGVAIIAAMAFNFFTTRVEQFVIDMNDVSSEFIDYVLREGRG
jgi:biopolymer transport protein ExbB/TolQ